jgi:hypothetical protein
MYVFEVSSYFTFGRETNICLSHKILIQSWTSVQRGKKGPGIVMKDIIERGHYVRAVLFNISMLKMCRSR